MRAVACTTLRDWAAMSVEERDRQSWDAIRHWPRSRERVIGNGEIDFAHATRWYLWDKVGRAIRSCVGHGTLERAAQPSKPICGAHVDGQAKVALTSRLRSSGPREVVLCFTVRFHSRDTRAFWMR
jgi:hypothetical protein